MLLFIIGTLDPYFSVYPEVTTRDLTTPELSKYSGFFVKYIIKPQPKTRGSYNMIIGAPAAFKICKVILPFIGENMPCTEAPQEVLTGYENTEIEYAGGDPEQAHKCGQGAEVRFKGLTSWGRDPIKENLIPDDDSIVVIVLMQVCQDATEGNHTISSDLTPGGLAGLSQSSDIAVGSGTVTSVRIDI